MSERCHGRLCLQREPEDRNPAKPERTCPFVEEVNDGRLVCDCCDTCHQECMEEI